MEPDIGILNGECVASRCQVAGWCPSEPKSNDDLVEIEGAGDFTVFIRVNARFPCKKDKHGFAKSVNNLPGNDLTPGVNLFTLQDILEAGGLNFTEIKKQGADLVASTSFDCDLDVDMKSCKPSSIQVIRIDTNSNVSTGYNTRKVSMRPSQDERVLQKLVGVRVRVQVTGKGRYFDIITLLTHFGSGVALLGLATVAVDFIVLHALPVKEKFTKIKYHLYEDLKSEDNDQDEPLLSHSLEYDG